MKTLLLVLLFTSVTAASGTEITSRDLIGTWRGQYYERDSTRFTFRPDHTFDGVDGDQLFAGKWRLHGGRRVDILLYSDYEKKLVSRTSLRRSIVLDPVNKTRFRISWQDGNHLYNHDVWTKAR